ncbi:hypothetical protein [Legionella sp. km772]|uniref:hypothetical protein n=1 Tax=Legionella sp. km772 TaxID=2498111 RepID=UPI000F8CDA5B|nr:hypothetical protein [Legionella sp. km772]RUR12753.1 hypothetical protein ELY15_04175 [Legionella sp. km772]
MTKYLKSSIKIVQTTLVLSSLICFSAVSQARDGCPVGQHPNPDNPKQCVDNGTTGLGTKCDPGQKKWYDPRTKQWNPC